jgi:GMP synthase-like glutamine amidotransferase
MRVRAIVIANAADADCGFVGERFRHHGFAFTEAHREHPEEWPELEGHDLILLLGSEWSVYWDGISDNVAREAALIQQAHQRGIPIFGICFGSQMVAHALGGRVFRAEHPEVGWHSVESALPQVIASGPWLQWHFDAFQKPPDFTELAHSPAGPQAIFGGRTFATQFHPEANESMLARWTSAIGVDDLQAVGLTPEGVMEQTRHNVSESRRHSDQIVDWFLESTALGR